MAKTRDSHLFTITETGELKGHACPIGGIFFDEYLGDKLCFVYREAYLVSRGSYLRHK